MRIMNWDGLEAILAERVFVEKMSVSKALLEVCRAFPDAPVQYLIFALASMANILETEWLSGSLDEQRKLLQIYRILAELSIDLSTCELINLEIRSCEDLVRYWKKTNDPNFT